MVPRVALRDGPLCACLLAGSGGFRQSWASFDLQPHPSGLCPHLLILSPECLCLPVTFSCLCVPMQMLLFQRHRLHRIWDPSSSGMTSPLPVTKTYFQARSRSQALGVRTSTCWGGGVRFGPQRRACATLSSTSCPLRIPRSMSTSETKNVSTISRSFRLRI